VALLPVLKNTIADIFPDPTDRQCVSEDARILPMPGSRRLACWLKIVAFHLTLDVQEEKPISFPMKVSFSVVPKEICIKNEQTIKFKYCHTMF